MVMNLSIRNIFLAVNLTYWTCVCGHFTHTQANHGERVRYLVQKYSTFVLNVHSWYSKCTSDKHYCILPKYSRYCLTLFFFLLGI